jgi:hypothetical protein
VTSVDCSASGTGSGRNMQRYCAGKDEYLSFHVFHEIEVFSLETPLLRISEHLCTGTI